MAVSLDSLRQFVTDEQIRVLGRMENIGKEHPDYSYYEGRNDLIEAFFTVLKRAEERAVVQDTPDPPEEIKTDADVVHWMVATSGSSEIDAIHVIHLVLESLETAAQQRVLAWLNQMRKQKEFDL